MAIAGLATAELDRGKYIYMRLQKVRQNSLDVKACHLYRCTTKNAINQIESLAYASDLLSDLHSSIPLGVEGAAAAVDEAANAKSGRGSRLLPRMSVLHVNTE